MAVQGCLVQVTQDCSLVAGWCLLTHPVSDFFCIIHSYSCQLWTTLITIYKQLELVIFCYPRPA